MPFVDHDYFIVLNISFVLVILTYVLVLVLILIFVCLDVTSNVQEAPNGTLLLKATPAAQAQPSYRAKKPEEVDAEAWAHVASEGGNTANATLVLMIDGQQGRVLGSDIHTIQLKQ